MLRFSEATVVSCSGAVLCLCSPLPFVDQHGTTVHLFMIYFSQWLGPDYTDKHSRLFEGQLDLCNDTQEVSKLWEHFQSKKGQWKNSTGSSQRRAFLSLSPGNKTKKKLIFYLKFICSYQCPSEPQKLKRRQEKKPRPGPFWHVKMHIWEGIIKNSVQLRRPHVSWSPAAQTWVPELEDLLPRAGAWKVQLFWGAPCTARGGKALPAALTHRPSWAHGNEGEQKHNSKSCRMESQGQQWENTECICSLNKVTSSMF